MKTELISAHLKEGGTVYVSITGLKFKHFWLIVHFYRYAIPSFMQAKKAKGVLFAEVRRVLGVEHTIVSHQAS